MQSQVDFGYFGPPEEHTQWTGSLGKRVGTYITPDNPSSEICGEVAAAFASASIALKARDPVYAGARAAAAPALQACVTSLPALQAHATTPALLGQQTRWPHLPGAPCDG